MKLRFVSPFLLSAQQVCDVNTAWLFVLERDPSHVSHLPDTSVLTTTVLHSCIKRLRPK